MLHRRLVSHCAQLLRTDKAQSLLKAILAASTDQHAIPVHQTSSLSAHFIGSLSNVSTLKSTFDERFEMLMELKALIDDNNEEIKKLALEDYSTLEANVDELASKLTDAIIPATEFDALSNCQLEITPGVGGVEASLFAAELASMYQNYIDHKGWKWEPFQYDKAPSGGIRSAILFVRGKNAYKTLRYEAGVHRVQRVPVTDRSRMHTSTAVVAVLPEPEKVDACISLSDVKVETMRASGPGGQNVNQRSTAVRLTHRETGIIVHCMDERTQFSNMEVGTKARAEKVRTYNFKDDQITEHRLGRVWKNVFSVLRGDIHLEEIIDALDEMSKVQILNEFFDTHIQKLKTSNT